MAVLGGAWSLVFCAQYRPKPLREGQRQLLFVKGGFERLALRLSSQQVVNISHQPDFGKVQLFWELCSLERRTSGNLEAHSPSKPGASRL